MRVKQGTIGKRILRGFGIVLSAMLAMAIVTFEQIGGIDRGPNSRQRESMPGLDCATAIRAAWFENYLLTQQPFFAHTNADSAKRDMTRLHDIGQSPQQRFIDNHCIEIRTAARELFNVFHQSDVRLLTFVLRSG